MNDNFRCRQCLKKHECCLFRSIALVLSAIFLVIPSLVFSQTIVSEDRKPNIDIILRNSHQLQNQVVDLVKNTGVNDLKNYPEVAEKLLEMARERRELISHLIVDHPEDVLDMELPEEQISGMPDQLQLLFEKREQLEGTLKVLMIDGEPEEIDKQLHARSKVQYYLQTANGKRFSLHLPDISSHINHGGKKIRVTGAIFHKLQVGGVDSTDGAIATESENIAYLDESGSSTSSSSGVVSMDYTFGEQNLAVLLVNFQDNKLQPYSFADVQRVVFTETNNFIMENSLQRTWLTGKIYGWFTLPITQTCAGSDIASAAMAAASDAGINLSGFSRLIYVFPDNGNCGWSGMAEIGGLPTQLWINGSLNLKIVGHEMGHNFGLMHSNALECGEDILGSSCVSQEYGDTLDIMGITNTAHYNAFQKERLGWLDAGLDEILSVEASGSFTIIPYELLNNGTKAIKVFKGLDTNTGAKAWFYIEYRRALGFDAFLANNTNVLNGVVIHTATDGDGSSSKLLDFTPASSAWFDWNDPALVQSTSYTDPDSGITITIRGASEAGITIDASLQSSAPETPVFSIDPEPGITGSEPVAVDDTTTTPTNTPVTISVLENDYDEGGSSLIVTSTGVVSNGSAVINSDNTITYKPKRKYNGSDKFSYTISNGSSEATANVFVTVGSSDSGTDSGSTSTKGGGGKGKK